MDDLIAFRRCLGRFATGVTVVTCAGPGGEHLGMTVNSFSSVSLEPPLILWNIAKVSRSLDAFLAAEYFGVNVLNKEQEVLAKHFAQSDVAFDEVAHGASPRGVPRIAETIAWFECRTVETLDSGDHHVIIAEVVDFMSADGEPLLFFRGQYRGIEQD